MRLLPSLTDLAGLWGKLAAAAAIAGALLLAVLKIRQGGRDAERVESLEKGLASIGQANTAAKNVDHSQEAIDHDPNNLDRVR
ncbi:MAG: hypothetical protein Q8K85_01610 [Hyphomicrobium sp.]|nr:hypothetical protein [Hyphomicrobium sp.]